MIKPLYPWFIFKRITFYFKKMIGIYLFVGDTLIFTELKMYKFTGTHKKKMAENKPSTLKTIKRH